uniref:uncharacterized protein LOC108950565 isoform X2 n=1 Tax=Ciona intestinalis TaxID=7719 RepID=UPI000EF4A846|nr:uncharacterized protein LOC108950565 isoform X2 [Ciona intestinalis]XP_026695238.1 uncharacterized protein LOC108950565 isoform X2 [Ciona intestinalis]|eukprot:XP_018672068.2 uncharacterized protein LOC108950565 isoform X2 [Ciona intestinalis]
MDSSEFDKVWNKTIKKVFIGKSVNVTDVRKLITSFVSKQPKDVQLAIARAEGHSLQMAEKVYHISHPHELVEKGRNIWGNLKLSPKTCCLKQAIIERKVMRLLMISFHQRKMRRLINLQNQNALEYSSLKMVKFAIFFGLVK